MFESLESRRLFTAVAPVHIELVPDVGASISKGVLRVRGNTNSANVITVANSVDGKSVDVDISWTTANNIKKHFSAVVPKSTKFSKINIFGGVHADTISVGLTNGALGLKTRIDAGRGNDNITAGGEADVIYAGNGNDKVSAGGNNDLVYGGDGNDSLNGGDGNDTLWGGNGADTIMGEAGNDKLGGVLGANTLIGGAGVDTFVVKALSKNPVNDFTPGTDKLVDVNGPNVDIDSPVGTM